MSEELEELKCELGAHCNRINEILSKIENLTGEELDELIFAVNDIEQFAD